MNPLAGTIIEYHILQSFPPTCLNRDDIDSPKSALIGGIPRARISSQCWKRAIRKAMQDLGIKIGVLTRHIDTMVVNACLAKGMSEAEAKNAGDRLSALFSKDVLFFFSEYEADAIADYAREHSLNDIQTASKKMSKEFESFLKNKFMPELDGVDIALFGRMLAQSPDLNIVAACSVAHAISTHKVENEIDFFTALDDKDSADCAAHMGSNSYNSATYYRYINLDLGQLYTSLHGRCLAKVIDGFTKALYLAVPRARQSSFTGFHLWDYAHIYVRKGQCLQASFDKAVETKNGFVEPSIVALEEQIQRNRKLSGSLFGKKKEYIFGKDLDFTIDTLAAKLADFVRPYEVAE